jgi:formimidoylglutamate deiminase
MADPLVTTRFVEVPAMVNAHSHAFQRDLRGAAERPGAPGDDFWTWRTEMFRLAGALEPEAMRDVAGRVYA